MKVAIRSFIVLLFFFALLSGNTDNETIKSIGVIPEPLITVLCYHHVDLHQKTPYSVTSVQFNQQLDALGQAGFQFISAQQLEDYVYKNKSLPERSALITFDDGNLSTYTKVYPLLKKRQIPWVLFVYPTVVNYGHRKYCVNWNEVRIMAKAGVTIGSHSLDHPFLTSPPRDANTPELVQKWLTGELKTSQKIISSEIGLPVKYFAVPFGAFDRSIYTRIKDSGYRLSFNVHGTNNGADLDPYNINRVIVLGSDSLASFMNKATARPIYFTYTYPEDLSIINDPNPEVRFALRNMVQYQEKTIELKVSGFKGVYLVHQKNSAIFDNNFSFKRKGFYLASVTARDLSGQLCRGNWLFRYLPTGAGQQKITKP